MSSKVTPIEQQLIDEAAQATLEVVTARTEQGWYDSTPSLLKMVETGYHWMIKHNRGGTNRMGKLKAKQGLRKKLQGALK